MKPLPHLLMLCLLLAGCRPESQSDLPTTRMRIGQRTYTLEIAADPVDRQIGLMRRDSMPDDHGMIFVFPDQQPRSFWMKDTRIPLDILFLDSEGQVVSIGSMKPHTGRSESNHPARYAIELNAGQAEQAGVKTGIMLEIPEDVLGLNVIE